MTEATPSEIVTKLVWAEAHGQAKLAGGAPITSSSGYQFQPSVVTVSMGWSPVAKSWGLHAVQVTGPRIKKDGLTGDQRGVLNFDTLDNAPDPHRGMPDWLVALVDTLATEIIEQTLPLPSVLNGPVVINT